MLQQRQIAWPAYLVAASLSVLPPIETVLQILPFRLGDPRWRFGVFGLLSNAMMIPMLGLLIAFVVSSYFEHRTFQRILGVVSAVIAAGTLIGLALFALDVLQVQGDVKPTGRLAFYVAAGTASTKAILGMITLAGFAWTAFRAPKKQKPSTPAAGAMIIGGTRRRESVIAQQVNAPGEIPASNAADAAEVTDVPDVPDVPAAQGAEAE